MSTHLVDVVRQQIRLISFNKNMAEAEMVNGHNVEFAMNIVFYRPLASCAPQTEKLCRYLHKGAAVTGPIAPRQSKKRRENKYNILHEKH